MHRNISLITRLAVAITVAALLERLVAPQGRTVAVLSGGNIDWSGFAPLLAE